MKTMRTLLLGALIGLTVSAPDPARASEPASHPPHATGAPDAGHDEPGPNEAKPASLHDGSVIELSKKAQEAAGISLAIAGPGTLQTSVELLGEIQINADQVVHVVPRVPGIAVRVPVSVGSTVEAGQLLAVFQSPELGAIQIAYLSARLASELAKADLERKRTIFENTRKMLDIFHERPPIAELRARVGPLAIGEKKAAMLQAYAALFFARNQLDRERNLNAQHVSSAQAFQEAQRDLEVAEAQFAAAEEQTGFGYRIEYLDAERAFRLADSELHNARRKLLLHGISMDELAILDRPEVISHDDTMESTASLDLDRHIAEYRLASPVSGVVLERHIAIGELIEPTSTCFLLGDLRSVWVDLSIYPRDLTAIRPGQQVELRAEGVEGSARGEIRFVQPVVNEDLRTGFCRVTLLNPDGLWRPGLFVHGTVATGERSAPVLVARDAVIRDGLRQLAFVQSDENRFEAREVRVGQHDATAVEILEGIKPGEPYAASGAFILKSQMSKDSLGEDDE